MTKLISMDTKYKARCGRVARVLATDCGEGDFPVVALVGNCLVRLTPEGMVRNNRTEDDFDLIEVPDEKELWIEVYKITKNNKIHPRSFAYASCEALQLGIIANRLTYGDKYELIATKKITIAEGESCL